MKLITNQDGATAVETAIVFPLLILFLFGIIEFSILLYNKAIITNASREGARVGVVFDSASYTTDVHEDNHPTDTTVIAAVNSYCQNYLITFGSGTVDIPAPVRTGTKAGDEITVTVNYPYNFLVIPNFVSSLAGGVTLNARTTMRLE